MMAKTLRIQKLCNSNNMEKVENRVYMQSLDRVACITGFNSVKAKYANDTLPFFASKNFSMSTKFNQFEVASTALNTDAKRSSLTINKAVGQFTVEKNEVIEKDADYLRLYESEKPKWTSAFNSISGLTSLKTSLMHR